MGVSSGTTDFENIAVSGNSTVGGTSQTVGDMTDLDTTATSSLVAAVNEVNTNADAANTAIGTLASLTTTAKDDIVTAINELVTRLEVLETP